MKIIDGVLFKVTDGDLDWGEFHVPEWVTKIEKSAFRNCKYLEKITIPDSVTKIGEMAFENCKYLKKIEFPKNVIKIADSVCYNCKSLERVTFRGNIVEIDDDAFSHCSSLKYISFPDSLERIGNRAFDGCDSLKSVTLPDSNLIIGDYAFFNEGLRRVTIPKNITKVGKGPFYCYNLKYINFQSSLVKKSCFVNIFDDYKCEWLPCIEVYGQIIDEYTIWSSLREVRAKELLDKITDYLAVRGVLDKKHSKLSIHQNFINTINQKYREDKEYTYEEDFNQYMKEYMINNNLAKADETINVNLKSLNDNIVNHDVKEFNPSGANDIINYGDDLIDNISKIEELVAMIPDNYGPTNVLLEEELSKLKKPRNIIQFFEGIKGNENVYLGKDSIQLLYYSTANNIYRLELGIQKLGELEKILELYIEKINDYKDNLLNYKIITVGANEAHKDDDVLFQSKIENKADSYDKHLILVNDIQEKIHNLINCYKIYIGKLQRIDLLLKTIKDGKQLNSGVVNERESLERLREILDFYNNIEESNVIKK